ncbi:MAG TPA: DegT/DnrJ/EryC1/StrS aminotransferase family protein [Patescibacteria group bacterium]|nr:DegT/DnrJ/EryC1/StrS aminotransferase family protein [Patescibacteria group bacterium]
MMKVEFYKHNIGEDEIEKVGEVLRSLFITTGDVVSEFEERLAGYLGLSYSVAVTSCTAAMQLALLAAGIGDGDEVITTPLTFIGTPNSILMAGALPVFADVDRATGNIDPAAVEAAVTARTRAILPVHLYGQMCDMDALRRIADRHGLAVIEDAAHSLEAEYRGRKPGHAGDHACFSFYATKNITSGEGGAISVKDAGTRERLMKLRLHGLSSSTIDRYTSRFSQYDVDLFGWKYNMDNIHAAILVGQLDKVDQLHARRGDIYHRYREALRDVEGIKLHAMMPDSSHAYHLFTILVDPRRRDAIMEELQKCGIGVSLNFHPVHLLTYYRERFGLGTGMFPVAEEIGSRTISLPLYPKLTEAEIGYVTETVKEVVSRAG